MKQIAMLKKEKSAYGGELMKKRAGRIGPRPLATRKTMHLVLRSTKAKGDWSFRRPRNESLIRKVVAKFSAKYGVRILSMANVGNHLHLQIKLANRFGYAPFIRAVTGAIAFGVMRSGHSAAGGNTAREATVSDGPGNGRGFWDYRPFTRVVQSLRALLNLRDYIRINHFEGYGYKRDDARFMIKIERYFERKVEKRSTEESDC